MNLNQPTLFAPHMPILDSLRRLYRKNGKLVESHLIYKKKGVKK